MPARGHHDPIFFLPFFPGTAGLGPPGEEKLANTPTVDHNSQRVSIAMNKNLDPPIFLESREVSDVVGIPSTYLNKLIERGKYGIEPSIRSGRGRGSRRLFSEADVYGLALVWWLFEAGLRAEAIQDALEKMLAPKGMTVRAIDAAAVLKNFEPPKGETDLDMIVIRREPRAVSNKRRVVMEQEAFLANWSDATGIVEEKTVASVLFIPFTERFKQVREAMKKLSLSSSAKSERSK